MHLVVFLQRIIWRQLIKPRPTCLFAGYYLPDHRGVEGLMTEYCTHFYFAKDYEWRHDEK